MNDTEQNIPLKYVLWRESRYICLERATRQAQKRRIPLKEGFSAIDCMRSMGQVVLTLRSANWS